VQEFLITSDHHRRLPSPSQSLAAKGAEKFQRVGTVTVNDVVHEKDPALLEGVNVLQYFFGGAETIAADSGAADRTEIAVKRTATASFDRAGEQIHFLVEKITARHAIAFH